MAKSIGDPNCSDYSIFTPVQMLDAAGLDTANFENVTQQEISFFYQMAINTP